ncbi:MAG: hypothetical protein U1E49_10065 [Hyphomicrobiaceae bacterium]
MGDKIEAHVWWSLYVQTSNKRKLIEAHLPPINLALEDVEFDWEIISDAEGSGLFRLINYQNLRGPTAESIIVPVLRRAYGLSATWTISGLEDLRGGLRHVIGSCTNPRSSNRPPALKSMMFEIEPGVVGPRDAAGGWPITTVPATTEPAKSGQLRRPRKPD